MNKEQFIKYWDIIHKRYDALEYCKESDREWELK